MAISISNLTNGRDVDGNSTASTASITPSSNKLVLVAVATKTASGDPNHPTLTGNGLTWVEITSVNYDAVGSQKRLTLFRGMGASPSTGAISIDLGGQNNTCIQWIVEEVTGMDTSGTNGSGAIVQSSTNQSGGSTVNTLTVTLSAFGSTDNATYGIFGHDDDAGTATAGSGFTIVSTQSSVDVMGNIASEFRSTNDTSVDISWDTSALEGGIAIEIKQATVASTTKTLGTLILMGVGN